MRRLLSICLLFCCLGQTLCAEETKEPEVLIRGTAHATGTVKRGTPLNLKLLAMPMDAQLYLGNFDALGFETPTEGAPIVSELVEDVYVSDDLLIPLGTRFHGSISQVLPPKNFGRDGKVQVAFHALQKPNGEVFRFGAEQLEVQSTKTPTWKKAAYGVARVGGYGAGGAVLGVGALFFTKLGSLLTTFIAPQYVFTGGAAVGLLFGTVVSIVRKGQPGRLQPGDQLVANLEQDLLVSVSESADNLQRPPAKQSVAGIDVKILDRQMQTDGLDQPVLILEVGIDNRSRYRLHGNDFVLRGPYDKIIRQDAFGLELEHNLEMQTVSPGQRVRGRLAFALDLPGLKHDLILQERNSRTLLYREELAGKDLELGASWRRNWREKIFGEDPFQ